MLPRRTTEEKTYRSRRRKRRPIWLSQSIRFGIGNNLCMLNQIGNSSYPWPDVIAMTKATAALLIEGDDNVTIGNHGGGLHASRDLEHDQPGGGTNLSFSNNHIGGPISRRWTDRHNWPCDCRRLAGVPW